jgi:high-affinity iron transporter
VEARSRRTLAKEPWDAKATTDNSGMHESGATRRVSRIYLLAIVLAVVGIVAVLIWQALTARGNPNPTASGISPSAVVLNIGILVFREGLECILVLAAITASLVGDRRRYQRPIAAGAVAGFAVTLISWLIAVRVIDDLGEHLPALALQAATGLLAVVVLIIVMNWFFHRLYWTGWISLHNRKKHELLKQADELRSSRRLVWGMALLGFSSVYREGFEVVLFLQSYRLKLGGKPVLFGTSIGLVLSAIVAVLTFVAHRRLPYRRMLILTGVMLGVVLLVMVGEQAQEMQLAHWLPTTRIGWLASGIPAWLGVWFSVFPTVETLSAQSIAAVLVIGSYFLARSREA